jgi:fructokinase
MICYVFEKELPHEDIFQFFHDQGVETVCLTLGSKGIISKGKEIIQMPAIKLIK